MTTKSKRPPVNETASSLKRPSRVRRGIIGFGPDIIDYRRFPGIRAKRLTLERVFSVCEQLGDYATTRNVQRILGGSLRDIAPLVKQWRDKDVAELQGSATYTDDVKAVGAFIVNLLRDHTAVLSVHQEHASRTINVSLQTVSDRLEELIERVAALEALQLRASAGPDQDEGA